MIYKMNFCPIPFKGQVKQSKNKCAIVIVYSRVVSVCRVAVDVCDHVVGDMMLW